MKRFYPKYNEIKRRDVKFVDSIGREYVFHRPENFLGNNQIKDVETQEELQETTYFTIRLPIYLRNNHVFPTLNESVVLMDINNRNFYSGTVDTLFSQGQRFKTGYLKMKDIRPFEGDKKEMVSHFNKLLNVKTKDSKKNEHYTFKKENIFNKKNYMF